MTHWLNHMSATDPIGLVVLVVCVIILVSWTIAWWIG